MSDNDYDYITIILQVRAKLRYPGNWPVNAANERNKQNRTTQTHTQFSKQHFASPVILVHMFNKLTDPHHVTIPTSLTQHFFSRKLPSLAYL